MKRMRHKEHGFTHAYDQNEEKFLRSKGWVDDIEQVEQADPPKRGRPKKEAK